MNTGYQKFRRLYEQAVNEHDARCAAVGQVVFMDYVSLARKLLADTGAIAVTAMLFTWPDHTGDCVQFTLRVNADCWEYTHRTRLSTSQRYARVVALARHYAAIARPQLELQV